jgi:hypothetical protein
MGDEALGTLLVLRNPAGPTSVLACGGLDVPEQLTGIPSFHRFRKVSDFQFRMLCHLARTKEK